MSKNFLTNDEHRAFNEIVFENRNKAYGAYALRSEANLYMQRAFFTGLGVFAVLAISPLVVNMLKPVPTDVPKGVVHFLDPIDQPVDVIQKHPIVAPLKPEQVRTKSLDTPTPTRNTDKETLISPKDNDALTSDRNREGAPADNQNNTSDNGSGSTVRIDNTPKVDPNAIPATVHIEAGFVGGIETFRNKVLQNFDTESVSSESGEIIKGVVTFVVEKDGTITNIKASSPNPDFSKEAEKTIKGVRGKWNPAKLNGQAVRSYFRFPISMQFQ